MEIVLPTETGEFAGCKIRKTDEVPPRVSVYDLIAAVKGVPLEHARVDFSRIKDDHPVTTARCYVYKFPGRGNLASPATDARGVMDLLFLMKGSRAMMFRIGAADIMLRALCQDEDEVQNVKRKAFVECRHRFAEQRRSSRSGYVYLVTSPLVNVVKIGCWRGSVDCLRKRYVTPYGPALSLEVVHVPERVKSEARMHEEFAVHNRGGELFDKSHLAHYRIALGHLGKGFGTN